jgi:hypothetical protein
MLPIISLFSRSVCDEENKFGNNWHQFGYFVPYVHIVSFLANSIFI